MNKGLGLWPKTGFAGWKLAFLSSGAWSHLKTIKTDEVGLLRVVFHEAHSPTVFHGPVLSSRGQCQVQLNNCSGQCLGWESSGQRSLFMGNQAWSLLAQGCHELVGKSYSQEGGE